MPILIEYAQCETSDIESIPIKTYFDPNATNSNIHGHVFDVGFQARYSLLSFIPTNMINILIFQVLFVAEDFC